ncbi:hypothetical protein HNQ07_004804 [Deinococcus metalli]|uniref:Cyclic nucleotide-binding domain-containing protein n=1 Tax=Deinococcus metalli TaxID=1141878 RepID=A0A7W8KMD9_9DEIO|nr:DUF3006 domain-containing protein [Deinococcus metalli]MBB5379289.1 hypothetical protein [Deinococcus metalli]
MARRKRTRSVLRTAASTPKVEQAPTRVVIDALEGDKARVELPDGTTADWDRASLPTGVREGDVIRIEGEGKDQTFSIEAQETEARRTQTQSDLDALNAGPTTGELKL